MGGFFKIMIMPNKYKVLTDSIISKKGRIAYKDDVVSEDFFNADHIATLVTKKAIELYVEPVVAPKVEDKPKATEFTGGKGKAAQTPPTPAADATPTETPQP
jgi:hypothetical protein